MKLCLGTAQIGMAYGFGNKLPPTRRQAQAILKAADGIEYFDTATAYGRAEARLGKYIKGKIITKIPPRKLVPNPEIKKEIINSTVRLKQKPYGVLFHTPEYIYDQNLTKQLREAKEEGLTEKIGVSVYDVKDGIEAVKKGADIVQIPYSVLDRRFDNSSFFEIAETYGTQIFARSAFLQGLLTKSLHLVKKYVTPDIFKNIKKFWHISEEPARDVLLFSLTHPRIDYVVIGVDNPEQLRMNIDTATRNFDFDRERMKSLFKNIKPVIMDSLWKG